MTYYVRKMEMNKDEIIETIQLLYAPNLHKLPFHFKNEEECIDVISQLIELDGTEYSAKNFWVCTDGEKIVGVIQAYDPQKIDSKKALDVYSSVRKDRAFDRDYKIWRGSTKPLQHSKSSIYLHNGHYKDDVSSEVSKLLIDSVVDYCKSINFTHLYTDVRQSATVKIERLKEQNFVPVRLIDDKSFREPFIRMSKSL